MTSRDFAYWLQGYFEIHGKRDGLTAEQTEMVKWHLALVFKHEIDPSFPAEQQEALNAIHHDETAFNRPPRPDGLIARC